MVARLAALAGLLAMPHRHRDALQRQRLALGIEPRGHAGATTQCNGEKVAWAREGDTAPGTLRWGAAAIYGLGFGAGSASLQSKQGEIALLADRKSVVEGKSVCVRVDLGGCRTIK